LGKRLLCFLFGNKQLFFYLQRGCMARVSPMASIFLLLRQKKDTKEKATPDRSKARNKINSLRRRQNSQVATVDLLRQVSA
jgi:hypothetical protein